MQITFDQANQIVNELLQSPAEQRDDFEAEFANDLTNVNGQRDALSSQLEDAASKIDDIKEQITDLKSQRAKLDGQKEYIFTKIVSYRVKKKQDEQAVAEKAGDKEQADAEPKSEAVGGEDSPVKPVVAKEQQRKTSKGVSGKADGTKEKKSEQAAGAAA